MHIHIHVYMFSYLYIYRICQVGMYCDIVQIGNKAILAKIRQQNKHHKKRGK